MTTTLQMLVKTPKGMVIKNVESGAKLVLNAEPGSAYQLVNPATGSAPKKISAKRIQNNLEISAINEAGIDSSIVIENYYAYPENALTGMGEEGKLLAYEPTPDGSSVQVSALDNGMESTLDLASATPPASAAAGIGVWAPLAGLAGLAALASVAAGGSSSSSDSGTTTVTTPDTTAPTVAIKLNPIAGNNAISAGEAAAGQITITGSLAGEISGTAAVTVYVNGHAYNATVNGNTFSVAIGIADLLATDTVQATVRVSDAAGNVGAATDERTYRLPNNAPTASNGSISTNEDSAYIGNLPTPSDADGDTVSYSLGTAPSHGTVAITNATTGTYTYTPAANYNGNDSFTYTVRDANGGSNTYTITVTVTPTNDAPTLNVTLVNSFTEDAAAAVGDTVATFTTSDSDGNSVSVTLSNTTHYALSGNNITLTAAGLALVNTGADLPAFTLTPSDGTLNGTAQTVDPAVIQVNDAPTLSLTSTPNVLENTASTATVVATFSTSDPDGNPVSVTLDDTTNYVLGTGSDAGKVFLSATGAALANTGADLPAFTLTPNDGTVDGVVVTVDPSVTPANDAPTLTVTAVNNVTENSASTSTVVATFSTADPDAGDTVSVTLSDTLNYALSGNTVVLTATGAALANTGADLPAFTLTPSDGTLNGTAQTVDPAVIQVNDAPTLSVTPIGVIQQDSAVDGTVVATFNTSDPDAGDTVSVILSNSLLYRVDGGVIELTAAGATLVNAGGPLPDFTLTPNDGAVSGSAQTVSTLVLDPPPVVTITAVAGDDIVNQGEAAGTTPLTITGTVTGGYSVGDQVSLQVNGNALAGTATVTTGGVWSYTLAPSDLANFTGANAVVSADISRVNNAGATVTSNDTHTVGIDLTGPSLTLAVGSITADNIINVPESTQTHSISGTVSGAQVNDVITFTLSDGINTTTYSHTLSASDVASGTYTLNGVSGSALAADSDTRIVASLTSSDGSGNSSTVTANNDYAANLTLPTITITSPITTASSPALADNIINFVESQAGSLVITGTTTGTRANDVVTLMINGHPHNFTLTATNGSYSIAVPMSDVLADTQIVATVSSQGNSASATQGYAVDITPPAPTLTINAITGDDFVNENDAIGTVVLTGTTTGTQVGDVVSFNIKGTVYSYTLTAANGSYNINVPGSRLVVSGTSGTDAITGQISTKDVAGNTGSASATRTYTYSAESPTVSISVADNYLSEADRVAGGTKVYFDLSAAPASGTFTAGDVSLGNGQLLNWTQVSATRFSADFVPNPNVGTTTAATTVSISVAAGRFTDGSGSNNLASNTVAVYVDTLAPTVALTTPTVVGTLKPGDTFTFNYTLNGNGVNGLSISDFVASGVTLLSMTGTTSGTITGKVTEGYTGTSISVSLGNGSVFDASPFNNPNVDGGDTDNGWILPVEVPPTAILSMADAAIAAGETATINILLSKAVGATNPLQLSDFAVNGVVGAATSGAGYALNGSGTNWVLTYTPPGGTTGNLVISLPSGAFSDTSAHDNEDGAESNNSVSFQVDSVVPSATITVTDNTLGAGTGTQVQITLSEACPTFSLGNMTAVGGELSGLVKVSDTYYTATFTPTSGYTGSGSILIPVNALIDSAGNKNSISASTLLTIDQVAPTISISADHGALKNGETTTVTFTVSEAGTDFSLAAVTYSGGTFGALTAAGDGKTYTAVFTPTPGSSGNAVISVTNGTVHDSVGNANSDGADTNNTLTLPVDTTIPTITISSSTSSLKSGQTAIIEFNLDERSLNFSSGDVTVTGGNLSGFAPDLASGTATTGYTRYTAIFTPTSNSTTNGTISVAAGSFSDVAGNFSTVGASTALTIDTAPPSVAISIDAITPITATEPSDRVIKSEADANVTISGVVTGLVAGDVAKVTLTIGGTVYADISVNAATGVWTQSVAGALLAGATQVSAVVQATDTVGNTGSASAMRDYTVDITPPSVTLALDPISGGILTLNETGVGQMTTVTGKVAGEFQVGDQVKIYVDDVVYATTVDAAGNFITQVSGAKLLSDPDHKVVATFSTSDANGNTGSATPATRDYIVDTNQPTVLNLDISSAPTHGADNASYYVAGETITVQVRFSEAVYVSGTPQIGLLVGSATKLADYAGGSGTNTLSFTYTVGAGDLDLDSINIIANSLAQQFGSTIRNVNGNDALLGHLVYTDGVTQKVDGIAPSATLSIATTGDTESPYGDLPADGNTSGVYTLGNTIYFRLQFNEAITLDTSAGTPRLDFKVDPTSFPANLFGETRTATYDALYSNAGTGTLVFKYVVQAGDEDLDGIEVIANAVDLNGAVIRDAAGNLFNGDTNAIGESAMQKIDGVLPTATVAITSWQDAVGFYQGTAQTTDYGSGTNVNTSTGAATASTDGDVTTDDSSFVLNITATTALDSGSQVNVYDAVTNTLLGVATSGGGLAYTFTDTRTKVSGTTYTYYTRVADAAGNVSFAKSADFAVTYDNTPLAANYATITRIYDDYVSGGTDGLMVGLDYLYAGDVADGESTNDTTPRIYGTLSTPIAEGVRLFIYRTEAKTGDLSVSGPTSSAIVVGDCIGEVSNFSGTDWWFDDTSGLTVGKTYNYTVRTMDDAGNLGAIYNGSTAGSSNGFDVTIDQTLVTNPFVLDVSTDTYLSNDGTTSNTYNQNEDTDLVTRDNKAVIRGQGPANEIVELSFDGGANWISVPIDSAGNWIYTDTVTRLGVVDVKVRLTDEAHNAKYYEGTFKIDIEAPKQITLRPSLGTDTGVTGDGITSNLAQWAMSSGAAAYGFEAGARIALVDDVNKNGVFELGVDTILDVETSGTLLNWSGVAGKEYNLGYVQWDKAGNISRMSETTQVFFVASDTPTHVAVTSISTATTWTGEDNYPIGGAFTLGQDGGYRIWQQSAYNGIIASTTGRYGTTTKINGGDPANADELGAAVFLDLDRDGDMDIWGTDWDDAYYGYGYPTWTSSGDSTYTANTLTQASVTGAATYVANTWRASIIAIDVQGDGYADIYNGNGYSGSEGQFVSNKSTGRSAISTDSLIGTGTALGTGFRQGWQASAVDLNKDGKVDLALNIVAGGNADYSLALLTNNSTSTTVNFTLTDKEDKVFANYTASEDGMYYNYSMTWGDFNGDGKMDLMLPRAYYTNGWDYGNPAMGRNMLFTGNGDGTVTYKSTLAQSGDPDNWEEDWGLAMLTVDWDCDGDLDVLESGHLRGDGEIDLLTNDGSAGFTTTQIGGVVSGYASGMALIDWNWDGARDIIQIRDNAAPWYIENINKPQDGTHLHLRVLDYGGINSYMANTVELWDGTKRVASRILNPQDGISNESTGIVDFYDLDPSKTYTAKLYYQEGGVSKTTSWSVAPDTSSSYVLTTTASTGETNGTITGTGYNDTFVARPGQNVTYVGGGGWSSNPSGASTWSESGGLDILDFGFVTATDTQIDLSDTGVQNPAGSYLSMTLKSIEGVRGGGGVDTLTDSTANNLFEGRGGDDVYHLTNGGQDILEFKLIDALVANGGNGHDSVYDFTLANIKTDINADVIDLSDLLEGYTGNVGAFWDVDTSQYVVDGASINSGLLNFIKVESNGTDTTISVDATGAGNHSALLTLKSVDTTLADMIVNHSVVIA
jgi:large repetitive protein